MASLFSIPIGPTKGSAPHGGTIVGSEPAPKVYLLTFTAPPDNRLTAAFCDALVLALDVLESHYPNGVVVTTSGIPKFYSNGLDLKQAVSTEGFLGNHLYRMWLRLLTFPMPTVALLNGHAFAAGFMTAMYHDYRVFNPAKGFLCINEIEFGVPLQPAMTSIFREKLRDSNLYRTVVLEAKRWGGAEALKEGIVDAVGGLDEVLKLVADRKLTDKGKTGIWGVMKMEMFCASHALLTAEQDPGWNAGAWMKGEDKRKEEAQKRAAAWQATKAKL